MFDENIGHSWILVSSRVDTLVLNAIKHQLETLNIFIIQDNRNTF